MKSTPINDSLKEAVCLYLLYLTGSFLIGYMGVRHSLLYYVLLVILNALPMIYNCNV